MEKRLTARQREILNFITEYDREKGFPPTIREIAAHFRIVSLNAVRVHLKVLERKGYLRTEPRQSRAIRILEKRRIGRLPLLGEIAAGLPSLAVEELEEYLSLAAGAGAKCGKTFLLRVKGDSMAPDIKDGDLLIVRSQPAAENGEIVVAEIEGEATVKVFHREKGRFVLKALNPAYPGIRMGRDFQISGKVIGLLRRY